MEMEESSEFMMEGRGDMMRRLDNDVAIHVLQYLNTAKDIACASAVCRTWRRFGQCFSLTFTWLASLYFPQVIEGEKFHHIFNDYELR